MLEKEVFWERARWLQMALKIFLEHFYTYSLFSQTSLGPWASPRANERVVRHQNPFLFTQTQPYGHFSALIPILSQKSSKREYLGKAGLDLRRPRKFFWAFSDVPIVFADILRFIAISQSNRGGHTTHQSNFNATNMTLWWNFRFDAPSEHILPKMLEKELFWERAGWLQMALKNFLHIKTRCCRYLKASPNIQ